MSKQKIKINPIMMFIILTAITILLSAVLSFFNVQAEYSSVSVSGEIENNVVEVVNLFNPSGLKYIATTAVSGFVNFAPLSMLIIVLIGIGILEKTGFMRTFFTLITQNFRKNTLTFLLIFLSLIFSLLGDIGYVVMLPIGALLFKYGKRNPLGGIIASFAGLSFGYGINIFLSLTDSSLISLTLSAANILDPKYSIDAFFQLFVMITALILISIIFTYLTEKIIMPKLGKKIMEDSEEIEEEQVKITNKELRGLILGIASGILYLLVVAYMIIPGLPFSGALLANEGTYYIDKLFGPNSLFSQGFVFIVTLLFVIIGLIYGLVVRNIKNNNDLSESLSYSLNNIGNILVLIFFASLFIGVFKKTNIGLVITSMFSSIFTSFEMTGIVLILVLFLVAAISNIFYTSPTLKWSILAGAVVPVFMNASLSPEYAQIIYTAGYSVTNGLTPILAYFVIYIAFMQKYNTEGTITLSGSMKYMVPYSLAILIIWFVIIIGFYITGIPLGIESTVGVNYVS